MYESLLEKLRQSPFRSRFKLKEKDFDYIQKKGMNTILQHAKDFIAQRIAPAGLPNDGKQTPMHGHPVFIAQHATACCCRKCIQKWHGFSPNGALSPQQQTYLVHLIMTWIEQQMQQKKP